MRLIPFPLLLLLVCAAPADASVAVWLADFSASGLNATEAEQLRVRVADELRSAGADDAGEPLDPACVERVGCVAERLSAGSADVALGVRLLRAGPVLQVSTVLHDGVGEPWREERLVQLKDLETGATLLSDALLQRVRALVSAGNATTEEAAPREGEAVSTTEAPPRAGPATTDTPPSGEVEAADEADEVASEVEAPATALENGGPPLLGIAGLGLAAGGMMIAVVGGAVAAGGNEVLLDPASTADEKAQASFYGPFAIGAAATGALIAVAGGALAVVGLWDLE